MKLSSGCYIRNHLIEYTHFYFLSAIGILLFGGYRLRLASKRVNCIVHDSHSQGYTHEYANQLPKAILPAHQS